jgi:ring-1,2-phenylacetyl-CoA epoxidase subunit PaaC
MPSTPRIDYLLHLADTNLILSHRNSEWCGHGPILEQDIALTNIALDLLGQARLFYQHAAQALNATAGTDTQTEDSLAYWRNEREFRNHLISEQPNGHWGQTILRQFLFSAYQHPLYTWLSASEDRELAAIAAKSLKETTYHLRWSKEWVIRLGDGTEESRAKMVDAVEQLWTYTAELTDAFLPEHAPMMQTVANQWQQTVEDVFQQATLPIPANAYMQRGGLTGIHTEHLGFLLAEMQYLQRSHPGATW